jgi:spartin
MTQHEAFLLLSLPDAILTTSDHPPISGTLNLECITLAYTPAPTSQERDVFLVLRIGAYESPLDPSRIITLAQNMDGKRVYTFHPCETDGGSVVLTIAAPGEKSALAAQDVETFDGNSILPYRSRPCGV